MNRRAFLSAAVVTPLVSFLPKSKGKMKVRDLLSEPSRWCKDTWCRTKDGEDCANLVLCETFRLELGLPPASEAYSFSLYEAITRCYHTKGTPFHLDSKFNEVLDRVVKDLPKEVTDICDPLEGKDYPIKVWNGMRSRKFSEVKALIEKLDI